MRHEDDALLHAAIIALLRKEHAAVKRMVKRMAKDCKYPPIMARSWYREACNNILAALDRRAKGGKG